MPKNADGRHLLLALAILVCAFALMEGWSNEADQSVGIDFFQPWLIGEAEQHLPPINIYTQESNRTLTAWAQTMVPATMAQPSRLFRCVHFWEPAKGVVTTGTPFLYAVLNSIPHSEGVASSRFDNDLYVYQVICMIGTVGSIIALCLLLGYSFTMSLLMVSLAYFWYRPLLSDILVGNVVQLQLAGVTLFILSRKKPSTPLNVFGGLLLGFLIAFKPNLIFVPLLLGLTWIFARRWKTLLIQSAAACGGLIIALIYGSLYLRTWSAWTDWLKILPGLNAMTMDPANTLGTGLSHGNYSLIRICVEWLRIPITAPLLSAVIAATVLVLWTRREDERSASLFRREYLAASLGCAIAVVALPLVWLHYYILLLPLLLYIFAPRENPIVTWVGRAECAMGILALLLLMHWPLTVLVKSPGVYAEAVEYVLAAWILFALGLFHLWHPRRASTL